MSDFVDRFFDAHLALGMLSFFILPACALIVVEACVQSWLRARRRRKRRERHYGGW